MNIRKQSIRLAFNRIALLLCLVFGLSKTGYMQADSAYYDLGRTVLRKDFTPVMTIAGEELQRFFYADVRDAIMARVGVMQNLVFVVDGTIINDINTYSVFDIQEVILLEQAVTATQGAYESRLLVLVTTHRQDEKAGAALTAAVKAGWIGEPGNGIYQQYYAGARYAGEKLGGGVSLDYLRDGTTLFEDRYKARVFGRYNVAPGHRLHAEVSYTPNRENADSVRSPVQTNGGMIDFWKKWANGEALQTRLGFVSRFSERLENEFTAAYVWNNLLTRDSLTQRSNSPEIAGFIQTWQRGLLTRNLLISDRLRYTLAESDRLNVVPQLHVEWRKGEVQESRKAANRLLDDPATVTNGEVWSGLDISLLTFSPSVDMTIWKTINVHGGALIVVAPKERGTFSKQPRRVFPFVTGSADVVKLMRSNSRWTGLITASYAQSGYFYDDFSIASEWNLRSEKGVMQVPPQLAYDDVEGRNNRIAVGAELATKDRDFALHYGFSRINSNAHFLVVGYPLTQPWGKIVSQGHLSKVFSLHTLNLTKRWAVETMNFQTGIRATRRSGNGKVKGFGFELVNDDKYIGLSADAEYFVQWNNTLTWRRFFAGVDAFYHRDPIAITITQQGVAPRKRETVSLQHLHAGYRVGKASGRQMEVYGYMRSALENNDAPYSSRYSYYGIGLRVQCAK